MAAAHQGGVLARHGGLIAVAVERPGLHLALVEFAAVQQLMEGMLVVIALGANGAKLLLEFLGAHDLGHSITSRFTQCQTEEPAQRLVEMTTLMRVNGCSRLE